MLKIDEYVLPSPQQWAIVIKGMRNPLNSWDKSDSYTTSVVDTETGTVVPHEFFIGEADHQLMITLGGAGSSHAKYRRMLPVFVTINAPLYWWKEFDTYKVGTVANSCSTMHKIHSKEFTLDDFSHEHLPYADRVGVLMSTINALNLNREMYLNSNCRNKTFWWNMIQLLPCSYNQRRTVMLNYDVLKNIYHDRRAHKLDEWHTFCDWIEHLPYSELIVGAQDD